MNVTKYCHYACYTEGVNFCGMTKPHFVTADLLLCMSCNCVCLSIRHTQIIKPAQTWHKQMNK